MLISIKRAIAEAQPVELQMRVQPLTGFDPAPEVLILAASRAWVLAHSLGNGLEPDGYIAVLRSHVRLLRTTKHRAFRKRALQAEGVWSRVLRIPAIDLSSAATILRSLQKHRRFAIVLCEKFEGWRSIHCRIEKVTADDTTLLLFDGEGRWERRPKRISNSTITQLRFGSRYLKLYQKYSSKTRCA